MFFEKLELLNVCAVDLRDCLDSGSWFTLLAEKYAICGRVDLLP